MKATFYNPLFTFAVIVIFISSISSCVSPEKIKRYIYLNNLSDSIKQNAVIQPNEPKIQPGDRLSITIGALDALSIVPYNQAASPGVGATAATLAGYLVNEDGSIQLPQLGKMHVEGLTREKLVDTLTGILQKYLMDPVVTVQLSNFKITVLGDVIAPGAKIVPEGRINLIEAIGLSGDLTIYGRRDNVLVIREINGKREYGRVNLNSTSMFSSPYFNLRQNDVVYVEMSKIKIVESDQSLVRNVSIAASVVSVLASLVVLIINITK